MLTFYVSISFAQYTPMTAAGYQFKRILCDSTLHIPSFCGIPTLRNSTAKNGAIAMDTCSGKFYMWTNIAGWSQIVGAGTDTTSLSNRIDQRVKYTDTAAMLLAYLRKQDTANKWVANVTRVNDTTIRVYKGNTITDLKILGKGTDTTSLSTRIDARVKYIDTASMLLPYLRKADTSAMLSKYLRKTDTASLSNRINLKVNISDTATMLSKYLRKTDTTNKWVNNVTKKNDSTITIYKGTTATDIILPRGSGGSGTTPNLQQVTDVGASTTNAIYINNSYYGHEVLNKPSIGYFDYNDLITYTATLDSLGDYAGFRIRDSFPLFNNIPNIYAYGQPLGQAAKYELGIDNNADPYLTFNGGNSKLFALKENGISFNDGLGNSLDWNIPNGTNNQYMPISVNGIYPNSDGNINITGGTGTVTNVATGYGLTGGPITTTGTLSVDTATLNDIYGQNGRFGNDTATVVMVKVHNDAGVTLTNGKVVAFTTSGTSSNEPAVRLANNKHDSTSANTLGFVSGTIAVNDTGWVVLVGKIEKLNTSAFANGDIIYLDSISGEWTKTKPKAPYHMVYLGVVTKANAGNGSIYVKCQNGYELDEIHDVQITTPANNNVLTYESSTSLWKNKTIATALGYTPIAPSDTSVFQRKSISSYSIMANNTNADANTTAQVFKDISGTYTGTITWNGTAPTTATISTYQWQQIGKWVKVQIYVYYTNTGTACSNVSLSIPADMPTPDISMFTSGALSILYTGTGGLGLSNTSLTTTTNAYMRRNAANNGNEFFITAASANYRRIQFELTYRAQ